MDTPNIINWVSFGFWCSQFHKSLESYLHPCTVQSSLPILPSPTFCRMVTMVTLYFQSCSLVFDWVYEYYEWWTDYIPLLGLTQLKTCLWKWHQSTNAVFGTLMWLPMRVIWWCTVVRWMTDMEEEPVDRLQHLLDAVRTSVFLFFSCLSRVSYFRLMSFSPLRLQLNLHYQTHQRLYPGRVAS